MVSPGEDQEFALVEVKGKLPESQKQTPGELSYLANILAISMVSFERIFLLAITSSMGIGVTT